jgi:hypothetical protein
MRTTVFTLIVSAILTSAPNITAQQAEQQPPPPPPVTATAQSTQQEPPKSDTPPSPAPPESTTPPTPPPADTTAPPPPLAPSTTALPEGQVATTAEQPNVLSDAASGAYERRESLPNVNIYLPEGQASVRLRKLIRNVLFESQIDYEFINGDISTFLRYKYYARNYTYRIGVFDSIEFPDLGSSSDEEFERVRGGLFLVSIPKDYNHRYFFLAQDDQLTFGDLERPDNRTSNIYMKVGYQYGTQFDERMNAIVGEQRGRITPVLTAFRDIGPQRTGFAAAITQAANIWSADYKYTKFEAEGLRRFDVTPTSFIFSRVHVGSFLKRDEMEERDPRCDDLESGSAIIEDLNGDGEISDAEEFTNWECYQIPQYELFRLGGREALKSIRSNDGALGTYEVHLTNELFVPVFRNRDYRMGAVHWNTLYAIGYVGAGTAGFSTKQITDTKRIVVDAGIGTESAITYRDWDVYLSVIYAHPIRKPDDVDKNNGFRFSIRTVR